MWTHVVELLYNLVNRVVQSHYLEMKMDDATHFVHSKSDKLKWSKAAKSWARKVGLPENNALSAWLRVVLNQAADQELAESEATEGKRKK